MEAQRSPVHDIVNALWNALTQLGARIEPSEAERWGFAIHAALSTAGREFHNHEHVIDLLSDSHAGPLECIAALYHDAVYMQVDLGPPKPMAEILSRLFDFASGSTNAWGIKQEAALQMPAVLHVFGRSVGDVLTPVTGLNELASAMVAWSNLNGVLPFHQMVTVVAAIEQTIPFRQDPAQALFARLQQLAATDSDVHGQLTAEQIDSIMKVAVTVGNLDIENFANPRVAEFLDNTWKLLPEANPSLTLPLVYSVQDYRVALHRMESFLSRLDPNVVFHGWRDTPDATQLASWRLTASQNLQIGSAYLRAKLFAIAFIEAIALLTGGDVPIDYFMGGTKSALRPQVRRIENFFPPCEPPTNRSMLGDLLVIGRASDSSFDIAPSPIAAYLFCTLGEAALQEGFAHAQQMWLGAQSQLAFLQRYPASGIAIINAASHLLDTRRQPLLALAHRLAGAAD
jgi:hypothetical protein